MVGLLMAFVGMSAAHAAPLSRASHPYVLTEQPQNQTRALIKQMTRDEKMTLVFGYFAADMPARGWQRPAESLADSAGYVPGIPRLRIPAQFQTDAGLGVATQRSPHPRHRTSLPSGLATAATWNPRLAYAAGAMIGNEAKLSGFNVLLAGGVNLLREPRNGRNFEYAGEDPLLAGTIVGEQIRGIQSNHILSTIKHFAFNDQETNRTTASSVINETAARMSDLLAFEIAIQIGDPAAVMCAYNRVNSVYACESDWLLNHVLKTDWQFKGFVLSDWGATHSTASSIRAGLDQESGFPFDEQPYFREDLARLLASGELADSALDAMAERIVFQMIAKGLMSNPVAGDHAAEIAVQAHRKIAQADAEEAIVLLKNEGLLPLSRNWKKIAVIGGHADLGVVSGGGSSQVYGDDGALVPNEGPADFPGPVVYQPSSPLQALLHRTSATVKFDSGQDVNSAAALAAASDVAVVFATQWTGESLDAPSLSLSASFEGRQDALIQAIAHANPNTVVVLETGGPVLMPWLSEVKSVLEAWYPGASGGEAIARVLTGEVNPSGHLPVTFPASEQQLPRPVLDPLPRLAPDFSVVDYNIEGAAVGYKWFDARALKPLFPFGFGLSYTDFVESKLRAVRQSGRLIVQVQVQNVGSRAGSTVVQVYAHPLNAVWESPRRLVGWSKVRLDPGEIKQVEMQVNAKRLAIFQAQTDEWVLQSGDYKFSVGESSDQQSANFTVHLPESKTSARH